MTSREIVKRAVTFQNPERIAMTLAPGFMNDILETGVWHNPEFKPSIPGEDEWHCVWVKASPDDKTMGQVRTHPIPDYSMYDDYKYPDYKIESRYAHIREKIIKNNESDNPRFVLGYNPMSLGHRPEYLRGTENAWADPYENPDEYRRMLDDITKCGEDVVDAYAKMGGIDAIIIVDDWGFQDRTMISPALFDQFCKPMYARLFKRAHDAGMLCFMHSCGHIVGFLESLIEAGLDVIQMDQQENMGVDLLSDRFGGRLCFWCPVDIQRTMITGSTDDVRAYAKNLIEKFGKFNGGFIAKWYNDPAAVGHSKENIAAMCESFTENAALLYNT